MAKHFVLIQDDPDGSLVYFMGLPLGLFWECGYKVDAAKKFATRASAVRTMQRRGKHREGWRVLTVQS